MRTEVTKRFGLLQDVRLTVEYQFDDTLDSMKDAPHHIRWNGMTVSGVDYNDAVRKLGDALEKIE